MLSGGKDGQAILFNTKDESVLAKIAPFKDNAVSIARFLPGQNFTSESESVYAVLGSNQKNQCGLFNLKSGQEEYSISGHSAGVSDISFQPLNEYIAVAGKDGSWSFHNIAQGVRLGQWEEEAPISSIRFHPDGLVLAVGLKTGVVKVYDIRDQKVAMTLAGRDSEVNSLEFSNKGIYLAASWKDQDVCRIFSLHKQC